MRHGPARSEAMRHETRPRVIKKYPNRRLYDTVESRYITLATSGGWCSSASTSSSSTRRRQEDITRSILLQVIAEQEHGGEPLMSRDFLSQVIRSYGAAMQEFVGSYLEQSMKLFGAAAQNCASASAASSASTRWKP